ncbi:hypothetical protein BKA58DRAFT_402082 [Alternaria rosae]|uniref:uncharacterized protein n=1 Tax=Alternaria rosae TaxID=1187941 RepID=UPI001E8CC6B8|nr:uncharacterized protein BKA58DRAFT_402082 [Alternaria rosae]KAH6870566.1 hypothetical protein BKA58DRAFT_402082 [Alternaria rosae]
MNTMAASPGLQEDELALADEKADVDVGLVPPTDWIGIPPLHHQTELWIPDTAEELARQTVSPAVHFPETWQRHRGTASPRSADVLWEEVPPHLVPFVPYIDEKKEKTAIGPQMHSPFPSYLIDVENGSLVVAPEHPRYVALSCVWGGAETSACVTMANLAALQMYNGLYSGFVSLPSLVRDAINLVKDSGLPHLWRRMR